jgi:hypothetical protein
VSAGIRLLLLTSFLIVVFMDDNRFHDLKGTNKQKKIYDGGHKWLEALEIFLFDSFDYLQHFSRGSIM